MKENCEVCGGGNKHWLSASGFCYSCGNGATLPVWRVWIKHLIKKNPPTERIGLRINNNEYGDWDEAGFVEAQTRHGAFREAAMRHKRNKDDGILVELKEQ